MEGIYFYITRPNKTGAGLPSPKPENVTGRYRNADSSKLQYLSHEVKVSKADSCLTIEFYPHNLTWLHREISRDPVPLHNFVILLGFERTSLLRIQ